MASYLWGTLLLSELMKFREKEEQSIGREETSGKTTATLPEKVAFGSGEKMKLWCCYYFQKLAKKHRKITVGLMIS